MVRLDMVHRIITILRITESEGLKRVVSDGRRTENLKLVTPQLVRALTSSRRLTLSERQVDHFRHLRRPSAPAAKAPNDGPLAPITRTGSSDPFGTPATISLFASVSYA
jgi:hypothetical protein